MQKIRNWSQKHTIAFSWAVVFAFLLLYDGTSQIFRLIPDTMTRSFVVQTYDILWPLALTVLCGYGFSMRMKGFGRTLTAGAALLGFYSFLFVSLFLAILVEPETQWQTGPALWVGILTILGVGIREELVFRGVITNALVLRYGKTRKGLWFTILFSSLLFSLLHATNIFYGVSFTGAFAQLMAAMGLGALICAIYLRGGNIWVPVLIHSVIDAGALLQSIFTVTTLTDTDQLSNSNPIAAAVMLIPQFGLTLFLLRKSKLPAVFDRLEALRRELEL